MKKNFPVVLGIDPGFDRLGWAVGEFKPDKMLVTGSGLITTDKNQTLAQRYVDLDNQLLKIIGRYLPRELAIETLFFAKNTKTALQVSQARGVILSTCARAGLAIHEYSPTQIKSSLTGYGRADKKSLTKMIELELGLKTAKMRDDEVDALAVLLTHFVLFKWRGL